MMNVMSGFNIKWWDTNLINYNRIFIIFYLLIHFILILNENVDLGLLIPGHSPPFILLGDGSGMWEGIS